MLSLYPKLAGLISDFSYDPLPGCIAEIDQIKDHVYEITFKATLEEDLPIGSWQVNIRPSFTPDFFYTPHLTPKDDCVVDMHVFRTPAMMMGKQDTVLCVMPVMDGVENGKNRVFLDFNAQEPVMSLGVTTTEICEHVIYRRRDEAVLKKGLFTFSLRLMIIEGDAARNPFRSVLSYFWQTYGEKEASALPSSKSLLSYVDHTYHWAFDTWKDTLWQEFELGGKTVGAPQMIVITKQSPNYKEPFSIREPLAIWNQAWFCSLRSAQGVYRYALKYSRDDLFQYARKTKELALSFPQEDGLFDAVIGTENVSVEIDGKVYQKGGDWKNAFFGNSNRNPVTGALKDSPRHILDMSWTALHMLSWYEELEKDERLLQYAIRYADRLITLADSEGFYPAWIDKETGRVIEHLIHSPECAVSVTFLMQLYRLTKEEKYCRSALKCMDALIEEVMPQSRWEDFETYWSCSRYGSRDMEGKLFERNASYKQCSLSPFFMAQALYTCYLATGREKYLHSGQRCLDEMLMFQSSFQPSYMPITVVGGFGVMNADAEVNDARQSMFAELILQYGKLLNCDEYIQRGYAALRASFSMMYCPENPQVRVQWEKKWPFLNEKDFGFMMENYGHEGYANDQSLGIGEFTIYDWGNGAASEAVMRIDAHFGLPEDGGKNA